MITIERYIKRNLRNYAFNIGDVSVIIDFYQMDIGNNPNQKIIKYDLYLEQNDKAISDTYNHLLYELMDVDLIKATSKIWGRTTYSMSITKLNLAYQLFGNLTLKVCGEYGDTEYFLYTNSKNNESDYISKDDKEALNIKIEQNTFLSLIKIAPEINKYCSQILNSEIE